MKKTILLFDMDGVLVEPRRYRASLKSTIDYFGRIMGWDFLYPGEETIAFFESKGIISEWDIASIYMAFVSEMVLETNTWLPIPDDFLTFCEVVKNAKISRPEFNAISLIAQLPVIKKAGFAYSDMVLYLIESGPARSLFRRLAETSLLENILQHTRSLHENVITRVFQEVFLGQTTFENTFHLPAINFDQSTQRIVDRPLISREWNEKLKKLCQSGMADMAIITARPSFEDYPAGEGRLEFSPEADIVVDQLGWHQFPVIGLGQLQYAADQLGCGYTELIKPSPVHALAAIGMIMTRSLLPSIEAAWDVMNDKPTTFYESFPELHVHIFEDSPVGIRGTEKAIDLLDFLGIPVQLKKWGIAGDGNKIHELEKQGAAVVPSVNDALNQLEFLQGTP